MDGIEWDGTGSDGLDYNLIGWNRTKLTGIELTVLG